MRLSSIQIQGFKSFADKTILKFGKGITGIVGPNGSGKSNISDAVRWVLGEQSTKNLRGQSMEDVIFGGTSTRRPHGFCEVTLNIDNSDRTLNFNDDFVAVTRKYYRSHESEYLINNASVRLKDINELFMDTGLGRDGYSMVGQGKIDAIIGTKSNERRDIFEEASGISKYRYRKLEAERKLTATDENLIRLNDIMSELKERVEPLRQQSQKAEQFLQLSEQKKNLEIGLWLNTIANFKQALKTQENKITACSVLYKEIEDRLEEMDSATESDSELLADCSVKIEQKRKEIFNFSEQTATLYGNISVIENDILHNNTLIERTQNEIDSLKKSYKSAKSDIQQALDAAEQKKEILKDLKEELFSAQSELDMLLVSRENFSRKIEDLSGELNKLSTRSSDLRVVLFSSQSAAKELDNRGKIINGLISEKNEEKTLLEKEYKQTEDLLNKTGKTITDCENSLKGYQMRFDSRSEKAEQLKEKINDIHLDIEAKGRRIQILEDLEKNMEGFNYSVKSVMQQRDSGMLRGIHGPVAGLISVKKEYAVAIETALGNALQNVVVDTDADAKRAIDSLKSGNSGRATFLPVDSIKAREFSASGYEEMYGYVGIASDLVDCDEKYREIVKYLLAAVVVAEDLDSAVSIAKKFKYHFKVVSLDGQTVNAGGSLTGGSLIKNAGLLSRRENIKKIKRDIEKLRAEGKAHTEEYNILAENISRVQADIVADGDVLKSAEEDKIRAIAELKRISELIRTAENMLSQYEIERQEGAGKISEFADAAKQAEEEIAEIEERKDSVQAEIDSHVGGRDSLSTKRQEITDRITAIKLSSIEMEKDVENLLLSAKHLQGALDNRDEKAYLLQQEKEDLENLNISKAADIEVVNNAISAIKEQIQSHEKEIIGITEKRNKIEKQITLYRTSEREQTLEREKISGELARLTERRETMLSEFDNVIRQLYDEYNLTRSEAEALNIKTENPADAKKKLSEIKGSIRALGNVNVSAIEEYKEVRERYNFMSKQISDVETSRAQLSKLINQLTTQMQEMFISGLARINECFSKTFTELFGGGSANLVLTDPDNVLESGIDINANLPGKNVPSLDGLSGGEKALVALSIYFAIMLVNVPPFCFLDEVDTALDDINVERFARFMKDSDFSTQFICVTHRRGTMESADMLYGVTMQEKGVTKLLELNVSELEKKFSEGEF